MFKIVEVQPRESHRVWVRFEGGEEGEIDLSHLAGRGVFSGWKDPEVFEAVTITEQGNLAWGKDAELCADALYFKLTNTTPEQAWGTGAKRESA